MDGAHDMGGLEGFGPVDPREPHPPAKDDWRARMFAIANCRSGPAAISADWFRHLIECIPPAVYLASEYFDRWYRGEAAGLVNDGLVTIEELKRGRADSLPEGFDPPLAPQDLAAMFQEGIDSKRPAAGPEAFRSGDRVRARLLSPPGHCRLPRYVRGQPGRIEAFRGWHLLADAGARGEDRGAPLYSVSFLAQDLWAEVTAPRDRVYLDLWESYLEGA